MQKEQISKFCRVKANFRHGRFGAGVSSIQYKRKSLQTYREGKFRVGVYVRKGLSASRRIRKIRSDKGFVVFVRGKKVSIHGFPFVKPIKTEEDYREALKVLDEIFDETTGPKAELAELLSILIEKYEDEHYPIRKADGVEVLEFLLERNELKQKDLVGILGGKSTVSEILNRKRPLNLNHIKALADMFHVSPATFV
jgi:HTH-type transcriptional regulator/antitoxin HigA